VSASFDIAFTITIGEEGSTLDLTYSDRGNWTSGIVGVGQLQGSKYGVSAYAYPQEDIAAMTLDRAKEIYHADRWEPNRGDDLPSVLAITMFDAAVNNGTERAAKWLQQVLGVAQDGIIGPVTLAAVGGGDGIDLARQFHQLRAHEMIHFGTWTTFADGWENRLTGLPFRIWAALK
jgi:lysozyme family protein